MVRDWQSTGVSKSVRIRTSEQLVFKGDIPLLWARKGSGEVPKGA